MLAVALLSSAAVAQANRVHYVGYVGHTQVIVEFWLVGKNCPTGRHCYDHAKVVKFGAVSYGWPDCPNLLESGFEFGDAENGDPETIDVNKRRHFHEVGGSTEDLYDVVRVSGHIWKNGRKAQGVFHVVRAGFGSHCSTGDVHWTIPRHGG